MHPNPFRPRGFSLIEMMVVIAIVGVLTAMSVAAYQEIGTASASQNAVNEMVGAMVRARARAAERQTDVWVVVHPGFDKRANSLSGGEGAYFVFEDKKLNFNAASAGALASGDVSYRWVGGISFSPLSSGQLSGTNGKLIDSAIFEEHPGRSVKMDIPGAGFTLGPTEAPFAGMIVTSGCSFCSIGPLGAPRGAIVFSPDGSARFIDGVGLPAAASGAGTANRAHSIALSSKKKHRLYVVAVSGPTAFIGAFKK